MLKQSCWKMGMDYKVNAVVYILAEAFAPLLGGGGGGCGFCIPEKATFIL